MKARPLPLALPAWLCLLLQPLEKRYLRCSSSEASGRKGAWYAQPMQLMLFSYFLPMYTFQWTTGSKPVFFYPLLTSRRSGVCACCIRGTGQWSVAAWKTLGISVLPTEAPQHPTGWVSGRMAFPQSDTFGNVTSSGTTAIWECRYSWSVLLSTRLRLHAVAGKIESTVSEIVWKAHSYIKKDSAAPPAAAAPCCYLNYKRD